MIISTWQINKYSSFPKLLYLFYVYYNRMIHSSPLPMKPFIATFTALLAFSVCFGGVAPITGTTSICLSGHKILSDVSIGGTWSSSDTAAVTVDSTGRIYGVAIGSATITYGVDTSYATTLVRVYPFPNVYNITGGGSGCEGIGVPIGLDGSDYDVVYTPFLVGGGGATGAGYLSSGGPIALGNVFATGSYMVIGFNSVAGCLVDMAGSVWVNINPLPPVIDGPGLVCEGATIVLTDSVTGGTWSSHSPLLATVNSTTGVVSGLAPGGSLISYTLPDGCVNRKLVTVEPMPVPVITYNWIDNTFYTDAGYETYQWYDSLQGLIPGATASSLAAFASQYYYVEVTNSYGCTRPSAIIHYNTGQLGFNELHENNEVKIFPVPAHDIVTISAPYKVVSVSVSNVLGQTVGCRGYNLDTGMLDISNLAAGSYFIKINGVSVKLLLKE